jgi:signal transduction histidine kinase
VEDAGIGISLENLDHIFDDFYRADDERVRKITGTGLGLTIAKKIVDSHFGRIGVESKVGQGSAFSVCLPCKESKK